MFSLFLRKVLFGSASFTVLSTACFISTAFGQRENATPASESKAAETTPLEVEKQLMKYIPSEYVHVAHHWLILHGRYICVARTPKCGECPLKDFCWYFGKNIK